MPKTSEEVIVYPNALSRQSKCKEQVWVIQRPRRALPRRALFERETAIAKGGIVLLHGRRQAAGGIFALIGGWVIAAIVGSAQSLNEGSIRITVLSAQPANLSGGDALVHVTLPSGLGERPRVTVADRDVTDAFQQTTDGWVGLVKGLAIGRNVLQVSAGRSSGQLELTNHSITGPILSGPHMTPLVCSTEEAGLGPPVDGDCSAPTKFELFYRTSAADFKALAAGTESLPPDLVKTTTREGRTVPYIVRVESGTINRAIYRIAVLDDATRSPNQPLSSAAAWNRRLLVTFGGGCGTNYNQGVNMTSTVLNDVALSRGFAVMTSTQNVLGQHCNDVLSGEALMMLKEHFIERYGLPLWTVGMGGSGGAMQQFLIGQNFPGLLDGLLPMRSFADKITLFSDESDCRLLERYLANHPEWTKEQREAVEGNTPGTCEASDKNYGDAIVATKGCGIPQELVYDPVRNPKGARCTIWDINVNSYGRDPATGWARRTFDNVGLEYGREALLRGMITTAQFLDLNRNAGGYDNDGNVTGMRTSADAEGVRLAYLTGRVNTVGGALAGLPILLTRPYLDSKGDVHDRVRDFTIRERFLRATGRADNMAIWMNADGGLTGTVVALALDTMSRWLDAIQQDRSNDSAIVKVVRAKPREAIDACWSADGTRIDEAFVLNGSSKCNALFPSHSNPRLVAGSPITEDILKCQLKQPRRLDYPGVSFTDAEWQRMLQVFPSGVCDYSKPGVNQVRVAGTYLTLPL